MEGDQSWLGRQGGGRPRANNGSVVVVERFLVKRMDASVVVAFTIRGKMSWSKSDIVTSHYQYGVYAGIVWSFGVVTYVHVFIVMLYLLREDPCYIFVCVR